MLMDLCPELFRKIVSLLPKEDLKNLAFCSKYCNIIVQPLLWTRKCIPYQQLLHPLPEPLSLCSELFFVQGEETGPFSSSKIAKVNKGITAAISLCHLKVLGLGYYAKESLFSDETFDAISGSMNLLELHLCGCFPNDVIDKLISSCSNKLKVLTIKKGEGITDKAFDNICRLVCLEKVEVDPAHMSDHVLKNLSKLPLKQIDIFKSKIINVNLGMSYLSSSALNLVALSVQGQAALYCNNSCLTDIGVKHISALSCLQQLDLSYQHCVGDMSLQYICTMSELKRLNLSRTSISDKGLKNLCKIKSLMELKLRYNSILGSTLHWLCETAIKRLDLKGSLIEGDSLKFFSHFQRLQYLNLSECRGITDDAARYIQAACEIVDSLEEVDIRNTKISSKGCSYIRSYNNVKIIYGDLPDFDWLDESSGESVDVSECSLSGDEEWTTDDDDEEDDSGDDEVLMVF